MRKLKNFYLYAIGLACISFVIYSCTAGQYDWENDLEKESELELKMAMSRSVKPYTLKDSIAETDEFLDCAIAFQKYVDKLDKYFSQQDSTRKAAIRQAAKWSSVGDSRCIPEAQKLYAFVKEEYTAYAKALNALKEIPGYKRLTEKEESSLRKEMVTMVSPVMMKTREEKDCFAIWEQQTIENHAQLDFSSDLCNLNYQAGSLEHGECLLNAAVAYNERKDKIWQNYEDCVREQLGI